MIYGVMRRDAVERAGFPDSIWGWDNVFLAKLALAGEFVQIEMPLYYRRKNRPDEDMPSRIQRILESVDPAGAVKIHNRRYPHLQADIRDANIKTLMHSSLNLCEKLDTVAVTVVCFWMKYGAPFPGLAWADPFIRKAIQWVLPKVWRDNIRAGLWP